MTRWIFVSALSALTVGSMGYAEQGSFCSQGQAIEYACNETAQGPGWLQATDGCFYRDIGDCSSEKGGPHGMRPPQQRPDRPPNNGGGVGRPPPPPPMGLRPPSLPPSIGFRPPPPPPPPNHFRPPQRPPEIGHRPPPPPPPVIGHQPPHHPHPQPPYFPPVPPPYFPPVPPPPPPIDRVVNIRCESVNEEARNCQAPFGYIRQLIRVNQLSKTECVYHEPGDKRGSYTYTQREIKVRNGCRAIFTVVLY